MLWKECMPQRFCKMQPKVSEIITDFLKGNENYTDLRNNLS